MDIVRKRIIDAGYEAVKEHGYTRKDIEFAFKTYWLRIAEAMKRSDIDDVFIKGIGYFVASKNPVVKMSRQMYHEKKDTLDNLPYIEYKREMNKFKAEKKLVLDAIREKEGGRKYYK